MEWGLGNNWTNGAHLVVNLDKSKHQKYRMQKAKAAWNVVRRLTRLPPAEKCKIVVSQIIPILLYETELHDTE